MYQRLDKLRKLTTRKPFDNKMHQQVKTNTENRLVSTQKESDSNFIRIFSNRYASVLPWLPNFFVLPLYKSKYL
jgi:hypothetical protein